MDRENQSLTRHLFTPRHILHAMWLALYRLNPVALMMNPVMFIVWMGAVIVTVLALDHALVRELLGSACGGAGPGAGDRAPRHKA